MRIPVLNCLFRRNNSAVGSVAIDKGHVIVSVRESSQVHHRYKKYCQLYVGRLFAIATDVLSYSLVHACSMIEYRNDVFVIIQHTYLLCLLNAFTSSADFEHFTILVY